LLLLAKKVFKELCLEKEFLPENTSLSGCFTTAFIKSFSASQAKALLPVRLLPVLPPLQLSMA